MNAPLEFWKKYLQLQTAVFILLSCIFSSCGQEALAPSKEMISEMNLTRGEVISCGPADPQLGSVAFETSCSEKLKDNFNLAIKLLHSFEYDEAEKVFANIIDEQPDCAMAYWGVAMSNFHPLWAPPSVAELKKGAKAVRIAQSIAQKTTREAAYVRAIAAFYEELDKADHRTRCIKFEKAMGQLSIAYPKDKEAGIFYALSLSAAADPADTAFTKQKKAGSILNTLYPGEPDHPGIVHYLIHTYDYPELAELALPAARKYASVAPSSAHALHMPSHIFTRLGLWNEMIQSNLASINSSQCYAQAAGMKGHWDEELHGLDYLVYGYLQKGENQLAKKQLDYVNTINEVSPLNFKVAYAFAAIPSRYLLENKNWKEAAHIPFKKMVPWEKFPWQKAIIHFSRLMGSVHTGDRNAAKAELAELHKIHDTLQAQKETYTANQVAIQIKTSEAWIRFKEARPDDAVGRGKNTEALALMKMAADMEDKTKKHSVTPGEVIPARELLGDLLLEMNNPAEALIAYEADLKKHRARFNGLYGAGLAAEKSGNIEKAKFYYEELLSMINAGNCNRPELPAIRLFLKEH